MSSSLPTQSVRPSIVCSNLRVEWPDGSRVLGTGDAGLDVTFPTGRCGLIGTNGSGKSTLLRAIAGELGSLLHGSITASGTVAYLPQTLPLGTGRTIADLLGIAARIDALRSIEAGVGTEADFTEVGDDWDVENRARGVLDSLDLLRHGGNVLQRRVGTLSGGEAALVGVAGIMLRRPAISLLDEPSNNLDARARKILGDAVDRWNGVLVIASHDRELLERVDTIVELRDGTARAYGGGWSDYEQAVEIEQAAARRDVAAATQHADQQQRDAMQAQKVLAHRARTAAKAEREKRVPKIVAHGRRMQAQVSTAKHRQLHADRLTRAREDVDAARARLRDDDRIRVELPDTEVPAGRDVLRIGALSVRGPERIALTGSNGSGKTTVLEAIVGRRPHPSLEVGLPSVPVGYLPQRLDTLEDSATVLDNVRRAAPDADPQDLRAQLARFRLRGDRVDLAAVHLSGGERVRVVLAGVLLAEPAPQLLLLDEPTNNLDLASVAQLVDALRDYRGALIVVSHDERFLADLGVRRRWQMADAMRPVET